MVYRLCA